MSASSTCASLTVCNLGITSARCTGFTKVHGDNEYTFVCDLEWSDERTHSIKRTFTEFQKFHLQLSKVFPELKQSRISNLRLPTSLRENVISLFNKDKRALAETRETVLDRYLQNLLKQAERIRQSNIVLSFFEPRATDPKPCKSHSPAEKSDSGIDLTGDRSFKILSISPTSVQTFEDHHNEGYDLNNAEGNNLSQQNDIENGNIEFYSSDEDYDGESEATETDDDTFDQDYFLDVGFGELMLQSSTEENNQPLSPSEAGTESSMWCSNLDKFSNILRSSMSNLHTAADTHQKGFHTLTSIEDEGDNNAILEEIIGQSETSETESQMNADDRQLTDQQNSSSCSSDEEFPQHKSFSKSSMKHYYLSMNNLNMVE